MRTSIPQPYRRIWFILLAALVLVTALAIAVVMIVGFIDLKWNPKREVTFTRGEWRTPAQSLLSSSMASKPVAGWRTRIADVGLPGAGAPYQFADDADPFNSNPYVGNIENRAYFVLGDVSAPSPQWWLAGFNMLDGQRLFAPVPLHTSHAAPKCYLNGPDTVLCIANATEQVTAWTIDNHSGSVTYTGPTDLRTYPARLGVRQAGIYAVAETQYEGVYGIGPTANTTWFVPGDGRIVTTFPPALDSQSPKLASQSTGRATVREVTFALSDGAVVKPEITAAQQQEHTAIYTGGFAAEIAEPHGSPEVQFFDDSGRRIGSNRVPGTLSGFNVLPTVSLEDGGWALFNPQGELLMRRPVPTRVKTRVIGDRLFVSGDGPADRHQFDMTSGTELKPCALPRGYLASDGKVALGEDGNANIGFQATAVDLATCDTLWTTTSPIGSFHKLWRINTTLVQISDDGTELMSLVAPG